MKSRRSYLSQALSGKICNVDVIALLHFEYLLPPYRKNLEKPRNHPITPYILDNQKSPYIMPSLSTLVDKI